MAENLAFLPSGKDGSGVWCYGNSLDSCNKYGRLYDWNTAMNGMGSSADVPSGVQGVCPSGWHLPSDGEWTILSNELGGDVVGGGKLKTSAWGGGNSSGFSSLPSGYRFNGGSFGGVGYYAHFWSASEYDGSDAWYRYLYLNYSEFFRNYHNLNFGKNSAFSVRCIQD